MSEINICCIIERERHRDRERETESGGERGKREREGEERERGEREREREKESKEMNTIWTLFPQRKSLKSCHMQTVINYCRTSCGHQTYFCVHLFYSLQVIAKETVAMFNEHFQCTSGYIVWNLQSGHIQTYFNKGIVFKGNTVHHIIYRWDEIFHPGLYW